MSSGARRAPSTEIEAADGFRLQAWVEDHLESLDLGAVRRILRHPFVGREVFVLLLSKPELRALYEVRSRIARHPRTPAHLALRLAADLGWRDLLEISVDLRLAPGLRRAAERYLLERLPRLAIGERIAIARRAHRRVLLRLREDPDERVIGALLANPRTGEALVVALAGDARASPRVIAQVAHSGHWRPRYSVRCALALNPQTPFAVQQSLLPSLARADLERVARAPALSSVVRKWAEKRLAAR